VVNIFFNHFIKPNPVLTVLQLGETSGVGQLAAGFKSSHGLGIGGAGGINARITYSTSHWGLELGYIAVGAIADGDALRLDNGLQILVAEGAQAAELLQIVVLVHPQEAAVLGLVDGTGLGLRILALVALAGVATQAILGQSLDIAGVTAAGGAGGITAAGTGQLICRLLVIKTSANEIETRLGASIQSSHTLSLTLTCPVARARGIQNARGVLVGVTVDTGGVLTESGGIVAVVGLARGTAGDIGVAVGGDSRIGFHLILAATSGDSSI